MVWSNVSEISAPVPLQKQMALLEPGVGVQVPGSPQILPHEPTRMSLYCPLLTAFPDLPFVLCLQAHGHLHILVFLSLFQSGRHERKLPEEGDQPGQARDAAECREAKPPFFQWGSCGESQTRWGLEGKGWQLGGDREPADVAGDQDTQSGLIAGVPEMILMETFRKMSPFAPAFEIQFIGKIKYFTGNCRLSGPQGKKNVSGF